MISREYRRGLTWEQAGELSAEGWTLVGVTTHPEGDVAITVYRDLDGDIRDEEGAE